jgi:16S rRNA (cytidine1402-2'-O)-methyltransferase
MAGRLYLIPTPLGATSLDTALPAETQAVARRLTHFIVENAKTARAFLKQIGTTLPLQQLNLSELNEHTPNAALLDLLQPLRDGIDCGLLSEAGCPAIADPGAPLVRLAHQHGITVKPLVGPSSIVLALMASGLIGQRFAFHGYLPAKPDARLAALKDLEKRSAHDDAAQIFIETPYRNAAMLETIAALQPDTLVSIACDLTLASEYLYSGEVGKYGKCGDGINPLPDLNKRPCVFILYRPSR